MTVATAASDARTYGVPPRGSGVLDLRAAAFAHLGIAVTLLSLATLIEPVAHPRHTAWVGLPLLVVGLVCLAALTRCLSSRLPVAVSVVGLLGFGAAAFSAVATGVWVHAAGASDALTVAVAGIIGAVVAGVVQVRHRSIGTVLALGLAAEAIAVGLVGDRTDADRAAVAAALLIVAVVFAAGALSGRLAPAVTAAFVSLHAAGIAAIVVVAGYVDVGPRLLALAIVAVAILAAAPFGSPAVVTLMIPVVGVTVALAGLSWHASNWPGVGVVVGGVVPLLAGYAAERRSRLPLRLGFPYALSTLLVGAGSVDLAGSGSDLDTVLAVAAGLVLTAVAVAVRRPFVLAVAIASLALIAPSHFAQSSATSRHVAEVLLAVAGLVVAVAAARSRRHLVVRGADVSRGDLPAGPGTTIDSAAGYDDVFDALARAAVASGPLLRADRDMGRLMAGSVTIALWRDAAEPRTVVRVWGAEEHTQLVAAAVAATSP